MSSREPGRDLLVSESDPPSRRGMTLFLMADFLHAFGGVQGEIRLGVLKHRLL